LRSDFDAVATALGRGPLGLKAIYAFPYLAALAFFRAELFAAGAAFAALFAALAFWRKFPKAHALGEFGSA
jgi:hypothetical protein